MNRPLRFGPLGSEGSNHSMIVRRYIAFRQIDHAEVEFFGDFDAAFEALAAGKLDFVLQVSVHPSHADMVARFVNRAHIVDTFIAPSKVLAIVTRKEIAEPKTIALQPATRCYSDLSRWKQQIPEASIMTVTEGLLEGRYDSGLTSLEMVEKHPDKLRVEEVIGVTTDVWVLFSRHPLPESHRLGRVGRFWSGICHKTLHHTCVHRLHARWPALCFRRPALPCADGGLAARWLLPLPMPRRMSAGTIRSFPMTFQETLHLAAAATMRIMMRAIRVANGTAPGVARGAIRMVTMID